VTSPETRPPKLRLLVLASTYPRWAGDPEPGFVHELSKRLTSTFDVTVLCPHAPGARPLEHLDGVDVVRYRYAPARWETLVNDGGIVTNLKRAPWKWLLVPGFILFQAWWARRLVRHLHIDVVHAHWLIPQGVMAATLRNTSARPLPYVVTSHGADLYALRARLLQRLKQWVLSGAVHATVVSSAMKQMVAEMGMVTDKVTVLPMGVDVSQRFVPDDAVARERDEVLFVGRLVEKKGVAHLIRAWPAVLAGRPSATLTIAGFGPDESHLRRLVHELGISSSVRFLGALPQSQLPALYRRAALFVAPFVKARSGDQDGLPVALMEAMACNCPILVGDVPGLHDLLGEHAQQVLMDPHNEPALARRIIERLSFPLVQVPGVAEMSAHVRARFDWDRIAAEYARLLEQAAQPNSTLPR
jgi:glycosyltransferase involved in cell wall biosynthesis